jgi:hypothetical protein
LRFTVASHPGLAAGHITCTFRTWKRPQVKRGGRYHVGSVDLVVDEIGEVEVGSITQSDARRSGFDDRVQLLTYLGGGSPLSDNTTVWHVEFHAVAHEERTSLANETDLSDEDVREINRRLDRLDAAAAGGPWTRQVLGLIAERPAVVSTELAAALGRDRPSFKADVRKLKRLGLTISLEVGYRLSPRGEAFLRR